MKVYIYLGCPWQGFGSRGAAGVAFVTTAWTCHIPDAWFQAIPASFTTDTTKDTAKPISQGDGTSVKQYLKGLQMTDRERSREHKVRNNSGNTKVSGGAGAAWHAVKDPMPEHVFLTGLQPIDNPCWSRGMV